MTWLLCPLGRSLDDGDVARLLTRTLDLLRQARQGRQGGCVVLWSGGAAGAAAGGGPCWNLARVVLVGACFAGRLLSHGFQLPGCGQGSFCALASRHTALPAAAKPATRRAPALPPSAAPQVAFCEPLLPPLRRAARQAAAAMDRKPISDLVA